MVIYLIWSEQVATWPIFPLSSHNDLQSSISNMASSENIAPLNAEMAPNCFEVSYWPILQIWYMPLQTVLSPYFPCMFYLLNNHLSSLFINNQFSILPAYK